MRTFLGIGSRNHLVLQETPRQCTRFLGIAGVGNPAKSKWLYAFTITAATHCTKDELTAQPTDVTEGPYSGQQLPPLHEVSGHKRFVEP